MWSKKLPCGTIFELQTGKSETYLYHKSNLGEFFLSSDTITHTYSKWKRLSHIIEKVWRKGHKLGFGNYFVFEDSRQVLDDHYYVNTLTGIPTINIIEYDPASGHNFNKHWHTHKDDMRNIDKNTLNAVGQTLLDIIYNE